MFTFDPVELQTQSHSLPDTVSVRELCTAFLMTSKGYDVVLLLSPLVNR